MNNGRALKGHRRIETAIGASLGRNQGYTGGWDISCICGWGGGNWPSVAIARPVYRAHIDHIINHCPFTCKRCGLEKPLSQMRPDYRYMCLDCFSALGNEWQQRNPVRSAKHKRNHHLIRHFGITLDEADRLLASQNGFCAICGNSINDSRGYSPHVDHDHITGNVRGVLCFNCNSGLGAFKDDIERLRSAIAYLERTSAL